MDRFTSNQDQNDHRPMIDQSSSTENASFYDNNVICNYLRGPHMFVAAAAWPVHTCIDDDWLRQLSGAVTKQ